MSNANRPFYGWFLVAMLWLIYGFGITPSYYSYGLLSKEMIADLGFDQTRFGLVFSIFILLYSIVGPGVGWAQRRIGIRMVMVLGALSTALGIFMMSRATELWHCVLGYSLLGGGGIGFTTIIPCQTLAQNWFSKRKALATAIIFSSGGIIGKFWPGVIGDVLDAQGWREAWMLIAGISLGVSVLAAVFVRETPESMGQHRDGIDPATVQEDASAIEAAETDRWNAAQAMRTWQFVVLVCCGVAYATPWGVAVGFGRLHFEEVNLSTEVAGALIGTMALTSIFGRFSGAIGDVVSASKLLGLSLIIEGVGMALILYTRSEAVGQIAVILVGLGFGTAYISVPVVFSSYFGRNAFGMTTGVRIFITGIFNGLGPVATGFAHDSTGSYAVPFLSLAAFAIGCGFMSMFLVKPPVPASG